MDFVVDVESVPLLAHLKLAAAVLAGGFVALLVVVVAAADIAVADIAAAVDIAVAQAPAGIAAAAEHIVCMLMDSVDLSVVVAAAFAAT